ncbi:Bacteriophage Rz lysis protein [compost metagenome]
MMVGSLIPASGRIALVLAVAFAAGWTAQGWRLGEQLAEQGRDHREALAARDLLHANTLGEISRAGVQALQREQTKRLELESQLQADDETNHRKLTDAQKTNARLRDQLATTELRLSVVLDAADVTALASRGVPGATGAGGLVDGASRARLDPAHAQRIVGITDDGDQGLIALKACQDYARRVSASK